jgi:hypothetical protein
MRNLIFIHLKVEIHILLLSCLTILIAIINPVYNQTTDENENGKELIYECNYDNSKCPGGSYRPPSSGLIFIRDKEILVQDKLVTYLTDVTSIGIYKR